jgi:acetyl-CoA carboxylase biotin carboxylase subunit
LGERDCSAQRRHQKLIEESPSPAINEAQRQGMAECATRLARQASYVGAGTVEFVMDTSDSRFYFLEMNTRIQVEHPVTEMVTGIDLVAEQIRVAQGLPLSFSQEEVRLSGHAIECRINAEDPNKNFLPKPGLISQWSPPTANGVRVDSHCFTGYAVPPFYDSLIAKLIVHADTRDQAIESMRQALDGFHIHGIATTVGFHRDVMDEPDFIKGQVTTRWVEQTFLPIRKARQKDLTAAQLAQQAAAES